MAAALDKVAEGAENDDERARWLAKAAALADNEAMGRQIAPIKKPVTSGW